jgi:hypothetical protein
MTQYFLFDAFKVVLVILVFLINLPLNIFMCIQMYLLCSSRLNIHYKTSLAIDSFCILYCTICLTETSSSNAFISNKRRSSFSTFPHLFLYLKFYCVFIAVALRRTWDSTVALRVCLTYNFWQWIRKCVSSVAAHLFLFNHIIFIHVCLFINF